MKEPIRLLFHAQAIGVIKETTHNPSSQPGAIVSSFIFGANDSTNIAALAANMEPFPTQPQARSIPNAARQRPPIP